MTTPLQDLSTQELTELFEKQSERLLKSLREGAQSSEVDKIKKSLLEIIGHLQTRVDSKLSSDTMSFS